MNAPAALQHVRAIREEFVSLCDRLDAAEAARNFLRNSSQELPAEERLRSCPQYKALPIGVTTIVDWALSSRWQSKAPTYGGLQISDADVKAAEDFLRQSRDSVPEDDEVWCTAENARTTVEWALKEREAEADALAAYQEDRYTRGTEAWLEAAQDYDDRGGRLLRGLE